MGLRPRAPFAKFATVAWAPTRAPFAKLATVAWGSDPVRHLLSSPRTGSEAHATARKAPTRAPLLSSPRTGSEAHATARRVPARA